MPNSVQLKTAAKRLPQRRMAQIRTRVHNVIKGKQVICKQFYEQFFCYSPANWLGNVLRPSGMQLT